MSGKTARWSVGVSGGSLSHLTIPEIAATAVALGTPSVELNWGQNFSSLAEAGEARRLLDALALQTSASSVLAVDISAVMTPTAPWRPSRPASTPRGRSALPGS